jgi:hypothetical protein
MGATRLSNMAPYRWVSRLAGAVGRESFGRLRIPDKLDGNGLETGIAPIQSRFDSRSSTLSHGSNAAA